MLFQRVVFLCFGGCSLARTLPQKLRPRQNPSTTASAPAALSTACGDIITSVDSPEGYTVFWAQDAYNCLSSVPFNPAVATRFLKYWNQTIQFQSTLAYLKNPPDGYQQPPVDVEEELSKIQQRVESGFYENQYAFEADFQLLTYSLNDAHVMLTAGALSAFSFGSPFEIASVSTDGKEPPKIYFTADIIDSLTEGWTPSPIKTINGEDVVEFLTKFAALNSWGYVEPHAEWNALMSSPTLDVQGGNTIFSGGATFYPGDNLTVHFENYTEGDDTTMWSDWWIALYNEVANATGPLTTGGDFYNYFVLGLLPESFDPSTNLPPAISQPSSAPMNWSVDSWGAFPEKPDVVQYDLGSLHTGLVSGYYLKDISTGILSLPSFNAVPATIGNYSLAVNEFILGASKAGLEKVIIDLQRNSGGVTLLAYTIFKAFFPDLMPYGGSRRRSFPMANALGSATTNFWDSLNEDDPDELQFKQEIGAYEWVITNRLNTATGDNFTSWDEYQGPVNANGDAFTLTEQYDLANEVFDLAAFDEWYPTMYRANKSAWPFTERTWQPDKIVLLTDGLCSSTCSLFVEMMTRAGVKTVVAGGRPQTGPMQAVSGNRGASNYGADSLDDDILFARSVDEWVNDDVNASLPEVRETGLYIEYAGVNLRDQVRKDDTTPLQFKYEAADCRVYYTLANLYNMTRLWQDVAAAAFDDTSRCVEGSTGFSTTNNTNPNPPPSPESERPTLNQDNPIVETVEFEEDPTGGLRDVRGSSKGGNAITKCPGTVLPGQWCPDGLSICETVPVTCPGFSGKRNLNLCLPRCTCRGDNCNCVGSCSINTRLEAKANRNDLHVEANTFHGFCHPLAGNHKLGCPVNPKTGF